MSRLDDCVNELGYGVVQLAALASKASELGAKAKATYEKTSAFLQEQIIEGNALRQGNQVLLQENADLKRQLEELKGERGDELLRGEGSRGRQSTGEPLLRLPNRVGSTPGSFFKKLSCTDLHQHGTFAYWRV